MGLELNHWIWQERLYPKKRQKQSLRLALRSKGLKMQLVTFFSKVRGNWEVPWCSVGCVWCQYSCDFHNGLRCLICFSFWWREGAWTLTNQCSINLVFRLILLLQLTAAVISGISSSSEWVSGSRSVYSTWYFISFMFKALCPLVNKWNVSAIILVLKENVVLRREKHTICSSTYWRGTELWLKDALKTMWEVEGEERFHLLL